MNTNLGFCVALHCAHAGLQLKLDNKLGIHHGISFNDFALLNLLAEADGGRVSIPERLASRRAKVRMDFVRPCFAQPGVRW
jgi:hypothetical protein